MMAQRSEESNAIYKWVVVGMLWLVCLFNYADRQAIFSVFPLLRSELHLSDVQLGVVGAAFMWVYALFGPVAGWMCDRLPRRTLVLGGLVFWSVITAATGLAHGYGQLVVLRGLGGLGEAFYFPAAMSLISDYHAADTRSRAMSIHQSSVYAGSIAGGSISALVAQDHGWRASFFLFGGLGIVLGLVMWMLLREPKRGMSDYFTGVMKPTRVALEEGLRQVGGNGYVAALIAVFMGANFVAVIFLTWMPSFLYSKFHLSLSMAGFTGTAYLQAASVLGVLVGGVFADRLVRRRRGGRMLAQACGLLLGTPFLFLAGWTVTVPTVIAAMAGFGFFKGMYDANICASLYDVIPVENRGVAVGIMNSLGWLSGGIAPVAIAVAARHYGMSACISATAMVYLFFGVVLMVVAQRRSSLRDDVPFIAKAR